MLGRIESASAIGKCSIEIVGRNRVVVELKKFKGSEFGIRIEFLPDPGIADSGGFLTADWGWAPMKLRIFTGDSSELELERKSNPFRVVIPKRTTGFDCRRVTLEAIWQGELLDKLKNMGRSSFSFDLVSEVSDEEILPVIFDFGRGMRSGGSPTLVSNAITFTSQLYTPISPMKERMSQHFRTYPDGSIHIDKTGPYYFSTLEDVSVTGPLLNLSRVNVESWEGIERGEDELLYSIVEVDGEKISLISHQACSFELLGAVSRAAENDGSAESGMVANIVGHLIETIGDDGMWRHDYPIEINDEVIAAGWTSCKTQALGAMGLIRAGEFLGEPSLKKTAEKAIIATLENSEMSTEINGWRIFRDLSGVEESCVLNSHLYMLMAISDIVEVRGTKKWRAFLSEELRNTEKILPLYDVANSTLFDLRHIFRNAPPNKASPQYHSTHVMQLRWLDEKVDSEQISEISDRWESYLY